MSDNPLSGKVGLDTTDFKAGITELNRNIRVIETGFRAAAAGMGDWDKSSSGLELRIKALTSQIDIQKTKVSALNNEYKRVAAEKGADSRAAQDLQIRLNKETETLNKMQGELKQDQTALKNMGNESKNAGKGVEDLGNKSSKTSNLLGGLKSAVKVGATAIAGMAVAAAGAIVGLGALVMKTAQTADDLDELSQKTGVSVQRLQELKYIADQNGSSLDDLTGMMAKLTKNMGLAEKSSSPSAEAFREMGISVRDSKGELRDAETVFGEALDALGKLPNETERNALAMQIFGRSAEELGPMMLLGKDGMAAMTQEAHRMGAVMSDEDVKAAADLNDKITGLKGSLQGTLMTLVSVFIPGISGAASKMGGFAQDLAYAVGRFRADPAAGTKLISTIIVNMLKGLVAVLPTVMQVGMSILQGIISGVLAVIPTLLPMVIQLITNLVQFIVQNLPMLIQAGMQILLALINGILPMLPMLLLAAIQMIITLATGLAQALPKLIPAVVAIIPQMVLVLIQNLPLLIQAALQLILALAQGLIAALPVLIPQIPVIVQAIFDALIVALPMIGDAAVQLVLTLFNGIVENLPMMGDAAGQLIGVLVKGVEDLAVKLWEVGVEIVEGVWHGIQGRADWFRQQIMDFFSGIVDAVKDVLGIPKGSSKVFKDIGSEMGEGVLHGWTKSFADAQKAIKAGMNGLANNSFNINGNAAGGFGGMQPATAAAAPMININITGAPEKELDMRRLARYIAAEIQRG